MESGIESLMKLDFDLKFELGFKTELEWLFTSEIESSFNLGSEVETKFESGIESPTETEFELELDL